MLFFGNIVKNTDNYKELSDLALRIVPQLNVVKDFDYLSIPLTSGQQIGLFIITLFFNILIAILLIGNEHRNTNIYNTSVDIDRFVKYLLSKEHKLRRIEEKYKHIRL
jgi:myosin heavy subunit